MYVFRKTVDLNNTEGMRRRTEKYRGRSLRKSPIREATRRKNTFRLIGLDTAVCSHVRSTFHNWINSKNLRSL
jgi:hypothetical protein